VLEKWQEKEITIDAKFYFLLFFLILFNLNLNLNLNLILILILFIYYSYSSFSLSESIFFFLFGQRAPSHYFHHHIEFPHIISPIGLIVVSLTIYYSSIQTLIETGAKKNRINWESLKPFYLIIFFVVILFYIDL